MTTFTSTIRSADLASIIRNIIIAGRVSLIFTITTRSYHSGEAKISQHDRVIIIHQYIASSDITMDNIMLMKMSKTSG